MSSTAIPPSYMPVASIDGRSGWHANDPTHDDISIAESALVGVRKYRSMFHEQIVDLCAYHDSISSTRPYAAKITAPVEFHSIAVHWRPFSASASWLSVYSHPILVLSSVNSTVYPSNACECTFASNSGINSSAAAVAALTTAAYTSGGSSSSSGGGAAAAAAASGSVCTAISPVPTGSVATSSETIADVCAHPSDTPTSFDHVDRHSTAATSPTPPSVDRSCVRSWSEKTAGIASAAAAAAIAPV
mmetsp:Transcript_32841/g.85961  ORF Transcript_32841/g.85961 Transcript_32841/m.85961 type:complete len:246 (+) Transcript_32841:995-1732(+)